MLLLFGMSGAEGILATLGVAGVVCCAAATAGDISQDFKTGNILGATPVKQQWMEVVGVVIPSFFIAPVLLILNHAYGIGTGTPGSLKAPQANLFANITKALFGEGIIPWKWVFIGGAVGVVIIVIDQLLKNRKSEFRMPIMAVAIGIYLPLTLAIPICLGGLIAKVTHKHAKGGCGVLFASGLIAGEALMGVLIGGVIYMKRGLLPIRNILPNTTSEILSIAVLLGVGWMLLVMSKRKL